LKHTVAVVTHVHVLHACQKQRLGPKLEGAGLGQHPKILGPPTHFCNRWT